MSTSEKKEKYGDVPDSPDKNDQEIVQKSRGF
jgi:hypothetical protein